MRAKLILLAMLAGLGAVAQSPEQDRVVEAWEHVRRGAVLWTPADVTTSLWLKEEGTASTWTDHSGNNTDADQITVGLQPSLTNKLNGLTVRTFDGEDDYMETEAVTVVDVNVSVFCVVNQTEPTPPGNSHPISQGGVFLLKSAQYGSDLPRFQPYLGGYKTAEGSSSILNSYTILGGIKSGTSINLYVDGALDGSTSSSETFDLTAIKVYIGTFLGASDYLLGGMLAEVIVCPSGLSETDRQKMEGYLAHKWGLTANLPSDHPYKTTAPTK